MSLQNVLDEVGEIGGDTAIALSEFVGIRQEAFGGIIYRKKLFDFAELDHFGTLVCTLLQEGPRSVKGLSEAIGELYDRAPEDIEGDISGFLEDLVQRGFVTTINAVPGRIFPNFLEGVVDRLEERWEKLPETGYYSAPLQFHWEITSACNLRCMHCYASAKAVPDEGAADQVDTLDWNYCIEMVDIMEGMGVVQINYLGGEPLIEKRFFDLLEETVNRGIDITFPTNGVLLDEERLQKLWDLGMRYITISLDSADPGTFERIRGTKGIFDRVVENIKAAKKMGFGVIVNAVATKLNAGEFPELIELLLTLEADVLKVIDEFPVGRGMTNIERLMLTPEEYQEFYRYMLEEIEPKYADRIEIRLNPRFTMTRTRETDPVEEMDGDDYRCSAGRAQCFCTADGDIYPCYLFYGEKEFVVGNVHDRRFEAIWQDPESFRCFREKMGKVEDCEGCQYMLLILLV